MKSVAEMSRAERLAYAGCAEQLYGVRSVTLASGKARGAAVWEAETAAGLCVEALPDSGLDLGRVRYKGVNMSFLCKNGYTSPYSFSPFEDNFLNVFSAGMLYTCGLMNVGNGCRDEGKWHAPHGRIHAVSAENRAAYVDEQAGEIVMKGTLREAELFGHTLEVSRTLRLPLFGSEISLEDEVTNLSPNPVDFMLLYHCNFGYPFLSEHTRLVFPEGTATTACTERAKEGMDAFQKFQKPEAEFAEQVYYHDVPAEDGVARVRVLNEALGLGAELRFGKENLPRLIEWKSMQATDYALGLEPANCLVDGRADEKRGARIQTLPGSASVRTKVSLRFFEL